MYIKGKAGGAPESKKDYELFASKIKQLLYLDSSSRRFISLLDTFPGYVLKIHMLFQNISLSPVLLELTR